MSDTRTLREVCIMLGVSRRAVQGYEENGLLIPSGRNKYGYLLYDEAAQKRIKRIKLYQQLGFKRKEIRSIIDAPDAVVKSLLERRIQQIREEQRHLESVIKEARELIAIL